MHAQIVPSGRTAYETPPSIFEPLNAEFGFTLDVCASADNAKVTRYFSEDSSGGGLARAWAPERCWLNPPYGRGIELWMRKALEESRRGALVVALVPSSTDTGWWHRWVAPASEIRFVRGRIKFVGAQWGAPHPHAIVVYRP